MAVTLPPAITPIQGVAEQIQQQGAETGAFAFQDTQVHLIGAPVLAATDLSTAALGATSLSDVVRNLTSLYYAAGYPGAQLTYALSGKDLYVHPVLGQVTQVQGSERLAPYFQGLVGKAPLTDTALEPRRVLASIHADRAGLELSPTLVPDAAGGDGEVLNLQALPESPDPTSIRAEFGNPGNRFVGRHFLDLGIRHALASGDEFAVSWRGGLTGLNNVDGADDYHEETAGWNRVTPYGIFGAAVRNVDYSIDLGTTPVNGDIQQAELDWLFPLAASFHSRWTVNFKTDYTDKSLSLQTGSTRVQSQEYTSVEGGTAYAYALLMGNDSRVDFDAGLAVRKGLGSDKTDTATTLADLGYLLFRPQASARYSFGPHWNLRLDLSAQITGDTVPEQSQWVLGGVGNVAAYLPGVITGDSGGLARLQLEYQDMDRIYGVKLTPRAFTEYGYTHYENSIAGLPGGTPAIADAGVELALSLTTWLETSVAYAHKFYDKDVDHDVLDSAEANVYFRLTLKL